MNVPKINDDLLKTAMIKAHLDAEDLAKAIGINIVTFYRKKNGESDFTRAEIKKMQRALNLDFDVIKEIFFAERLT